MSDRPKELSPFMTADSFRQFLKLYKGFYKLHTDSNYGLNDTGGIQYAGSVYNFGSELLMETNKLRLKKPPLESIDIADMMKMYFDIQFVDGISDYAGSFMYHNNDRFFKQNMVCGLLKEDRMYANRTYELVYDNISLVFSLGSNSTSDSSVRRMAFFKTTTPPVLRITESGSVNEYPMTVDDGSGIDTVYYFPLNKMTYDMIGVETDGDIYDIETAGTFTINISNMNHVGIPYIWFCVDRFRKLPELVLGGNTSISGDVLITPGVDGNNIMHLYPAAGVSPSLPDIGGEIPEGCEWFLKAYGDFNYTNINGVEVVDKNETGEITRIEYLYSDKVNPEEAIFTHVVTCNNFNYKVCPNKNVMWNIHKPKSNEYDYNPTYYENKPYVWVPLSLFFINETSSIINDDNVLLAAFDVKTDDRGYTDYFEPIMNHGVSGVHVDYTTDFSENGVIKTRGAVRDLGKFDGLPVYYSEWMRETHRAHVELYSIRDNIYNNNNPMKRQTSALMVDSGVPQVDIDDIGEDLSVVIEYEGRGVWDTTGESESKTNFMSDVGYVSPEIFGYTNMIQYITAPKFIYHGNGIFSLGFVGFDPELEYARVYSVTNDPIEYKNNSTVLSPMPARTAARICDIPTSYLQLTNIKRYAPTYALDQEYIRQQASWTIADDEKVWNEFCQFMPVEYDHRFIFQANENLDDILTPEYLDEYYSKYGNFGRTIDMSHIEPGDQSDIEFNPYPTAYGTGYEQGDEFMVVIGGCAFKGYVLTVLDDSNGGVESVYIYDNNNTEVKVANIPSNHYVWKTTTLTGDGTGLKLVLDIDDDLWNSLQVKKIGLLDELWTLKFDDIGRIWIWKYIDGSWTRYKLFIGEDIQYNYYDQEIIAAFSPKRRGMVDTMLYNHFTPQLFTMGNEWKDYSDTSSLSSSVDITEDLSEYLTETYDHDETYYIPYTDTDNVVFENHRTTTSDLFAKCYDKYIFPQYHRENTFYAYEAACKLNTYSTYRDDLTMQPDVYIYNPMATSISEYYEFTATMGKFVSKSDINWKDIFGDNQFVDQNGVGFYNIYSYSYKNDIEYIDGVREDLNTKTTDELLDIISEINAEALPIQLKDSTLRFSDSELVDYIIERKYVDRSGIQLIIPKGEQVLKSPIQPVGAYKRILDEYESKVYTLSGNSIDWDPTMIFKITGNIENLDGFRMYDDLDNDISEYVLILFNNVLYVFNSYSGTWKRISTNNQ